MPLASRIGLFRSTLRLELPLSRWELDETGAGASFADLGPAAVPMARQGTWADLTTASLVQGVAGTSAYTDGSAYATIPAGQAAHALSALTISLYYQRDSAAAKHILLAGGDGSQVGDFSLEVLANGMLRGWHVGGDGTLRFFQGTDGVVGTDLAVGTAHRIDLTLGPAGSRPYLDGAPLSAANILANANGWNNGRVKFLGRWIDGTDGAAIAAFDRVRLWGRQLSPAEIALLAPARRVQLPGFRFIDAATARLVLTAYPVDSEFPVLLPIAAETASLVLTAYDVAFRRNRRLMAETAHLELTGRDAGLLRHRRMAAEAAHLALTGHDVAFILRNGLLAEAASLVLTAHDVALLHHRRLAAEAAHLALTAYDATLRRRPAPLVADTASLALTAYDADLLRRRRLEAETAHLELTAYDAELEHVTPGVTFGTIQTAVSTDNGTQQVRTLPDIAIGADVDKLLVCLQFDIPFDFTGDVTQSEIEFDGNTITPILWSRADVDEYRFGYAMWGYLDNPPASGDLVADWVGSQPNRTLAGTFIPIFGAAAGGAAFGQTARFETDGSSAALPLQLTPGAADSWLFSAMTRRDNTDGPFSWDDGEMDEVHEWAGAGNIGAASGAVAYRQASGTVAHDVGGDATDAGAGVDFRGTVAALELLNG